MSELGFTFNMIVGLAYVVMFGVRAFIYMIGKSDDQNAYFKFWASVILVFVMFELWGGA